MRKSMKKMASLILASAMAMSLAACGGKDTAATTAATEAAKETEASAETTAAEPAAAEGLEVNTTDPITITMSSWAARLTGATIAAVEKFMEKYPNITVETQYEHGPAGKIR